jgi:hypothetical protein
MMSRHILEIGVPDHDASGPVGAAPPGLALVLTGRL